MFPICINFLYMYRKNVENMHLFVVICKYILEYAKICKYAKNYANFYVFCNLFDSPTHVHRF